MSGAETSIRPVSRRWLAPGKPWGPLIPTGQSQTSQAPGRPWEVACSRGGQASEGSTTVPAHLL